MFMSELKHKRKCLQKNPRSQSSAMQFVPGCIPHRKVPSETEHGSTTLKRTKIVCVQPLNLIFLVAAHSGAHPAGQGGYLGLYFFGECNFK